MSRKNLETPEDFLKNEPYRSIINILRIAPMFDSIYEKGLQTREINDLIIKDYNINKNRIDPKRLELLEKFRFYLLNNEINTIKLDQDIRPGRYKKKINIIRKDEIKKVLKEKTGLVKDVNEDKKIDNVFDYNPETSTTFYHLLNDPLNKLVKFGWIVRKDGMCCLTDKYNNLFLRLTHRDNILKCSVDNILTVDDFVFYFPNEAFDNKNSYLTVEDFKDLSKCCKEISEKVDNIGKVFKKMGERKIVDLFLRVVENFNLYDALKEYFYICLVADFSTRYTLQGYDFSQIIEGSKEYFTWYEPAYIVYDIVVSAAEKFLINKYGLNKEKNDQLLEDYKRYRNLHSVIVSILNDFKLASNSFTLVNESPGFFLGAEKPFFSKEYISKFKSCKSLSDLDGFVLKIKNERSLNPFEPVDFSKMTHIFYEKQVTSGIVSRVHSISEKGLVQTERGKCYFHGGISFFDDLSFLDCYDNADWRFLYKLDVLKNDLKRWSVLFGL